MLEEFWQRACEQTNIPLEVAIKWFQQIVNRYHSRHYHNDKLLIFKMELLDDSVASHLVFAIFFQYYEFDVRDFGYVENCNAFNTFYQESGIDIQILLESVLQLLGDPRFNNEQIENDLLFFQDLDLAIFGASPTEYKMYANELQKEYVHMDENTYKSMRLKARNAGDNSFLRNIQNQAQSTPVKDKNAVINLTNTITTTSKKRKRKSIAKDANAVDVFAKRAKMNESADSDDSDVEIIADVPEIIEIDDDDDETSADSSEALEHPNAATDTAIATATVTNSQTNQNEIIPVDTIVSTENGQLDSPNHSDSLEQTLVLIENGSVSNNVENNIQLPCSSTDDPVLHLYIKDTIGGGSMEPPLYETVSEDSFCFDSTPTLLSQVSLVSKESLDSPIDLSDSNASMRSPKRKRSATIVNGDDSVVFVSETIIPPQRNGKLVEAPNFIAIDNRRTPKRKLVAHNSPRNNRRRPKNITAGPIGTNLSGPSQSKPIKGTKRMVIIDGSNVAYSHAGHDGGFSIEGIDICLNYFIKRGYEAQAVLPSMRLKRFKSTNQELLVKLQKEKKIVFTPCKNLSGGHVTSYDDRFILDFAYKFDAVVISNDNFRDLRNENEEYKDIINNRVIGYTFMKDVIAFPKDPYGKAGPSLEEILTRQEKT